MANIQLQGKIFLKGTVKALTGLHIGGSSGELDIGGNENPVIRNQLNRLPYIPGSSLRGKIRSLLDRHLGNTLVSQGSTQFHECRKSDEYVKCSVCQVFGVTPQYLKENTMPTRLVVRDTFLSAKSQKDLKEADTDTDYTEIKTEVSIDRITSASNPRPLERVPADSTFEPMVLVYGLFTRDAYSDEQITKECERFDTVLKGMELLEDDYLGGSGSRGSGQIAFENLTMTFKSRQCYEDPNVPLIPIGGENTDIATLRKLDYKTTILKAISGQ